MAQRQKELSGECVVPYIIYSAYFVTALPSSMRAAASAMIEANGAPPDDVQVLPFDEFGADAMDWVEDDDGGISAEGGELDDAVCAAYEQIILS